MHFCDIYVFMLDIYLGVERYFVTYANEMTAVSEGPYPHNFVMLLQHMMEHFRVSFEELIDRITSAYLRWNTYGVTDDTEVDRSFIFQVVIWFAHNFYNCDILEIRDTDDCESFSFDCGVHEPETDENLDSESTSSVNTDDETDDNSNNNQNTWGVTPGQNTWWGVTPRQNTWYLASMEPVSYLDTGCTSETDYDSEDNSETDDDSENNQNNIADSEDCSDSEEAYVDSEASSDSEEAYDINDGYFSDEVLEPLDDPRYYHLF